MITCEWDSESHGLSVSGSSSLLAINTSCSKNSEVVPNIITAASILGLEACCEDIYQFMTRVEGCPKFCTTIIGPAGMVCLPRRHGTLAGTLGISLAHWAIQGPVNHVNGDKAAGTHISITEKNFRRCLFPMKKVSIPHMYLYVCSYQVTKMVKAGYD